MILLAVLAIGAVVKLYGPDLLALLPGHASGEETPAPVSPTESPTPTPLPETPYDQEPAESPAVEPPVIQEETPVPAEETPIEVTETPKPRPAPRLAPAPVKPLAPPSRPPSGPPAVPRPMPTPTPAPRLPAPTPAPAPPTPRPEPEPEIHIGGDTYEVKGEPVLYLPATEARPLRKPHPIELPEETHRARFSGQEVVMTVLVSKQGRVSVTYWAYPSGMEKPQYSKLRLYVRQQAEQEARSILFEPARDELGKPVPSTARVRVPLR